MIGCMEDQHVIPRTTPPTTAPSRSDNRHRDVVPNATHRPLSGNLASTCKNKFKDSA
jgi:hypothetical protein